ncbi:LysR substrate-binding domain-containing protein [Pseudoxanthomonas sp. CF125]|uniref:LysR family transcriptional regulator n=1 Tax=Pseudoxanthomonas sp. CF125 TaxID=1855303 RepID=UPI000891EA76|nr:LysR substrate-binding domain-containing protein [Pseudoxanthomonas sp. CF125]SDQ81498.1 DNA-binding transcriptional regulator, LysR family [Pseudoxanthomonas sp. CF125]
MNLHLLRMFLTVVEEQGFSRAAEVLHVSQSAVSKGVRELEHQLGLALIEDRRGIRLTEAGEALLPHARNLFALERIASEVVEDRLRLRQGRLRIGASTTIGSYWLPAAVAEFTQMHPGVAFEMEIGNMGDVARSVIDCTVDIGFIEGATDLPGLTLSVWREEPIELVAGTQLEGLEGEVSMEALCRHVWLMREAGSGTRQVSDAFLLAQGMCPTRRAVLGSNEAIVRAAAGGGGVAMVPRCVAEDLITTCRLRSVRLAGAKVTSRPLYIVELTGRSRSPVLSAFLAHVEGIQPLKLGE